MVKDSYRIIYFISLFLTWWWVHFILYECLNQLWTPVRHQHQPLTRTRVSIAVSSNRHPELYRSNRCASARGRVYLYMFIVMYGRRGIFPVEAYSGRSRERSSYSSYSSFTVSHPLCSTQREIWRTPIKLCRQMDILILCILNIFSTVFSLTLSFFLNGTWSYDSKKWISINIVIYYCLNSALIDAKTRKHHIQTVQEKLVCSDQQQHDKVIAENQVMRICRSHTNNQCNHRQPWQLASNWLLRRCNKCWSKFPHRQCTQYMCIIASNQMEQQKTREKKNTWKAHE